MNIIVINSNSDLQKAIDICCEKDEMVTISMMEEAAGGLRSEIIGKGCQMSHLGADTFIIIPPSQYSKVISNK